MLQNLLQCGFFAIWFRRWCWLWFWLGRLRCFREAVQSGSFYDCWVILVRIIQVHIAGNSRNASRPAILPQPICSSVRSLLHANVRKKNVIVALNRCTDVIFQSRLKRINCRIIALFFQCITKGSAQRICLWQATSFFDVETQPDIQTAFPESFAGKLSLPVLLRRQ